MTGEKLGAAFFAYLVAAKRPPMGPNEPHAYLFGDDEYVVSMEQKKVTLPGVCEIDFEQESPDEALPEWIAVIEGGGEIQVVAGTCDPFSEQGMELLPHKDGHIRAMPIWVKNQAATPRVQTMLAKHGQPKQGWKRFIGGGKR